MHDLDRNQAEMEWEDEALDLGEYEVDDDNDEFNEYLEFGGGEEEEDELELAAELLSITSDEELEQFLGKLISRAVKGVKRFAKSKVGRTLGRALKGVAKVALPIAGKAAGTFFGGPLGGMAGGALGRSLSSQFEGMPEEELELEAAKRVIRITKDAARQAAQTAHAMPPSQAVKAAVVKAVKKHAPVLLKKEYGYSAAPTASLSSGRSGRWVRRGNRIILTGI